MNDFTEDPIGLDVGDGNSPQVPLSMLTGDGTEMPGAPSYDSSFAQKKSGLGGMILIVMVLLVGGGVLMAMRMTGGVAGADKGLAEAEAKIDQALRKLTMKPAAGADAGAANNSLESLFKDADTVVHMFANDPSQKQVTLEDLQKNPFELFVVKRPAGPGSETADALEKLKAQRLVQIKKELSTLKLQSLLNGRNSLAVINEKVLREGEAIGSFTVTSITPTGVRLTAEGNTYTLSMEKPVDGGQP